MTRDFDNKDIEAIYRVIEMRRDMRHFLPTPLQPGQLERLLTAAHHAPSVGYMQPWRFIRVTSATIRSQLHAEVEREKRRTAEEMGPRKSEFLEQKIEGMMECGELLVVALSDHRETHIFGRRTLPHMDMMSVACAIQNLWLAARAEGLGMGWVSFFDPAVVKQILHFPQGAEPLGILCLGHVEKFYTAPLLAKTGWAQGCDVESVVFENQWGN